MSVRNQFGTVCWIGQNKPRASCAPHQLATEEIPLSKVWNSEVFRETGKWYEILRNETDRPSTNSLPDFSFLFHFLVGKTRPNWHMSDLGTDSREVVLNFFEIMMKTMSLFLRKLNIKIHKWTFAYHVLFCIDINFIWYWNSISNLHKEWISM